jgi:hypothetical protein
MRRSLTLAVALIAGCSSQDSISTPQISDLVLAASTVPGATITGTFLIANSAGVGGLSLSLTLTDSAGASSPTAVEPLTITTGESDVPSAQGEVKVMIPSGAPTGTYSVRLTVSDGDDTSNALTGTFLVD